ncbi:MAG: LytTR family transcriptional regulator [Lachnospiraceae bacterium]|nr:LytTR family transcriptional regulator [Lachnospiraceae bacterium]
MKISLAVSEENYDAIRETLLSCGIEVDDGADFILTERDKYVSHLAVRDRNTGEKLHVPTDTVIRIESFGKEVEVVTSEGRFQTSDRVYQLMFLLDPAKFMRISNSMIVNLKQIRQIRPSLSQKFVLLLTDGSSVDVTRSYYHVFKDRFGI